MTPDIQIGNARRVVFTALALVAFWRVVIAAHRIGDDLWREVADSPGILSMLIFNEVSYSHPASGVFGLTLLPAVFVFLSSHNSSARLREPRELVPAALFAGTIAASYWIGGHNVMPCSTLDEWAELVRGNDPRFGGVGDRSWMANERANYHVSPLWLLLPLLLTTAFVIYGAWRQAVRGAEAAGEDDV